MRNIFYTSDLHFGHYNIIKYENRPFNSIESMTEGLIQNWNSKLTKNDIVYILGDFAFQNRVNSIEDIQNILLRLNGEKHLIIGNHDNWVNKKQFNPRLFESINYYLEIKDKSRDVILCHYPIENWNGMTYGSIHLHGHLHSNPTTLNRKNRFNVGTDNWNYFPVTLDEILTNSTDTKLGGD